MARRPRPVVDALAARLEENHPLAGAILQGARNAAARKDTEIVAADAPAVAVAVAAAIDANPVAMNSANREPWWQSRIKLGLALDVAVIALGGVLRLFGVDWAPTAEDRLAITEIAMVLGTGVATIGRYKSGLAPIDWRRPWTIFGLGKQE
jgi:hypothetical protein